nr:EOG090X080D [Lepidurus arcticus]
MVTSVPAVSSWPIRSSFNLLSDYKYTTFKGKILRKWEVEQVKKNIELASNIIGATDPYLLPKDEQLLLRTYELQLREFCRKFQPPMPRFVVGTALQYMKRFYLVNSVMDYHPKEILVTCIYLACKVEEFNVSIDQFVANIRGDRVRAANIILDNELLLMQQLAYNLTVHNPFRPMEGLLIDIKTRCTSMKDPDKLRPGIDEFLDKVFLTDSLFLFSPSQTALAAIIHAASKVQENMDVYVTETLFNGAKQELMSSLIEAIRRKKTLAAGSQPNKLAFGVKKLVKKWLICRNAIHTFEHPASMPAADERYNEKENPDRNMQPQNSLRH